MAYYRQPKFYSDFHCIGGNCPITCCSGWRILWLKDEIDKLKSANCSTALRELINTSFVPDKKTNDKNKFKINISSENNYICPLQNKEGLCSIQLELGEEYLSETCRVYPRFSFYTSEVVLRSCTSSCVHALEQICSNDNAMNLVNVELKHDAKIIQDTQINKEKHPELNYRQQLFEFFYAIISKKNRSLETSIILGALAAQKLTEYVEKGEAHRIPEIIKALTPQLNAVSVPAFEKTQINYSLSMNMLAKLVSEYAESNILLKATENGELQIDKYEKGKRMFNDLTKDKPYIIRNMALNFLFESNIPFLDIDRSIMENYCYFAATVATVKMIGYLTMLWEPNIHSFPIYVAPFIRGMYASLDDRGEKAFKTLKENNCFSPAHIAMMMK